MQINNAKLLPKRIDMKSKVYYTFLELDDEICARVKETFGIEKLKVFKERLDYTSDIVVSFINGKFASFCFFAYAQEEFEFFTLPKDEVYFYDCFTFPEFRGLNAIYSDVRYVLGFFINRRFKYANVEIENWNKSSIKAFTKIGFYKIYEFYLKRILFFERVVRK